MERSLQPLDEAVITTVLPPQAPPARRPARVMMINLGYPPNVIGGTEVLVQSLARAVARQGTIVSVVSLSQNGADWERDDGNVHAYFIAAHPMGIALLDPKRTRLKKLLWHALGEFNIWSAGKLATILKREKPDVIHTHSLLGLSVSLWRVARAHGIPIVHTLHDYQLLCPRGTMFRADHPCATLCRSCHWLTTRRRRASTVPNAVVGISDFILQAHRTEGYFPHARYAVIPNGIDAPAENTIPHADTPAHPWRIGFIGRLHPIKGIALLIDSLRSLSPDRYVVKIAGTGSADYEAQLKARAQGLPVEFLGWVQPAEFYAQIDVLVIPSLYDEPQGLVLLEAARAGITVIYSNRGGLAEMGAAFPDFIAFDPAHADNLSNALRTLLVASPPAARHQRTMPARFTGDTYVASYRRLYDTLRVGAALR
jgi:glycosyltransferase involved in cell wall biosynthesis